MAEKTHEELMSEYLNKSNFQSEMHNQNQQYQQMQMPESDVNLIKEQLDLGPELKRMDYLLRSYSLVGGKWEKTMDENLIVLSDYGVHIIREFLAWYINKNTLLSNYEEDMILDKMKDLSTNLNELIFRNYEKIFLEPSFDSCKKELMKTLEKRAEVKKYAGEIVGIPRDTEQIKQQLLLEMEDKIELELYEIKRRLLRDKLKRFSSIMRVVQDAIHSTYNRAWNGQERRSIRQHMTVVENRGGFSMEQQAEKKTGAFKKLFGG